MEQTVLFRDFEERDIDFVYRCKNDEKLNRLVVGEWHPFTYEEAVKWVHGCMGEHDTYKFWAVCTNDDEKRIVGWVSISEIDVAKKTACFHGIVIADPLYRDGLAEIESYLFVYHTCFVRMELETVYGASLMRQNESQVMGKAFFCERDEIIHKAVCRDGIWYDMSRGHLSKQDYMYHLENNEYNIYSIIKRVVKLKKGENQ